MRGKAGVLECWSTGVLDQRQVKTDTSRLSLRHTTPSLHCSITPLLRFSITPLLLLLAFPVAAQTPARTYADLVYPAAGNIELDEGTVEVWVIGQFDAAGPVTNSSSWCTPFNLVFPDASYTLTYITWGKAFAQIGYAAVNNSYVWRPVKPWKPGEFHQVAWTWNGRMRSVYVDGEAGGKGAKGEAPRELEVESMLMGNLSVGVLHVGKQASPLVVDEIRISSVARTPEEIRGSWDKAPGRDAHTLLLDHCDGGPAEVVTGAAGGKLIAVTNVVEAKFGKGLQLWK